MPWPAARRPSCQRQPAIKFFLKEILLFLIPFIHPPPLLFIFDHLIYLVSYCCIGPCRARTTQNLRHTTNSPPTSPPPQQQRSITTKRSRPPTYISPASRPPRPRIVLAVAMSSSIPGPRDLPVSRHDLSTYWGRVLHSADLCDPRYSPLNIYLLSASIRALTSTAPFSPLPPPSKPPSPSSRPLNMARSLP
jgi:hypothetical protein